MQCLGFGKNQNTCTNQAGGKMRPRSKYWCDRCEKLRREHITKQLKGLNELFDKKPSLCTCDAPYIASKDYCTKCGLDVR